jgi:hypothetical protein
MQGSQAIWMHVVTVGALLIFKLAVLIVGYLIGRLGYELLVKGVSGEFKFHTNIGGTRADLLSASPGLFFILMATILLGIGVLKDKPFETTVTPGVGTQMNSSGEKPTLPETPLKQEKSP